MAISTAGYNYEHLRCLARRRLPKWLFEAIDRGSEDEWALEHNRDSYERIKLWNRTLVDISGRDLGVELFGRRFGSPFFIAPTGIVGLCWYQGELELARAAASRNVPFILATNSLTALEDVAEQATGELWFQLYLSEDRSLSMDLVRRAAAAGYKALVVTVDFGLGANREYNTHNGFTSPFRPTRRSVKDIMLRPRWMTTVLARYLMTSGMPRNANLPMHLRHKGTMALRAEAVTWNDFRSIRDAWSGEMIVKGIVHPEDAVLAAENGADAIVVSNHGGRNMDSAVAPIDALPKVVEAVAGRTSVLLDSGIRRGSDAVKAMALGAKAVLVGRAPLWGLTAMGREGAELALDMLKREYELTLAYVGRRGADELDPSVVDRRHSAQP